MEVAWLEWSSMIKVFEKSQLAKFSVFFRNSQFATVLQGYDQYYSTTWWIRAFDFFGFPEKNLWSQKLIQTHTDTKWHRTSISG